jgi:hypothetical protein
MRRSPTSGAGEIVAPSTDEIGRQPQRRAGDRRHQHEDAQRQHRRPQRDQAAWVERFDRAGDRALQRPHQRARDADGLDVGGRRQLVGLSQLHRRHQVAGDRRVQPRHQARRRAIAAQVARGTEQAEGERAHAQRRQHHHAQQRPEAGGAHRRRRQRQRQQRRQHRCQPEAGGLQRSA